MRDSISVMYVISNRLSYSDVSQVKAARVFLHVPDRETSADTSTNSTTVTDAGELMKQAAVQIFYPDP